MLKSRGVQWLVVLLLGLVGWGGRGAWALPHGPQVVQATTFASMDGVHGGDAFKVAVVLKITDGFHIQAHQTSNPDYIPTTLTWTGPGGDVHYPNPQQLKLPYEDKPLNVYTGQVVIVGDVVAPPGVSGVVHVTGTLRYQGCNDQACLPPGTIPITVDVPLVPASTPTHPAHGDVFSAVVSPAPAVTGSDADQARNSISFNIASRGWAVALLLIFLQGLALDLTPCVYPLIPITLSFFGSQSAGDEDPRRQRTRTFLLAMTYVLGMCTTYSLLGVFASLTGHLFGSALQSPIVLGFVAVTFFALSLSMLGAYELTVPSSIASRIESKKGVWGALFMGLFVGIVAAPCVGPFVLGLVTYVGTQGNPVLGFWLFFTMALGMGLPFLVLGWFSGSTRMLPRSGAWMVWVKKVMGLVMMGIAFLYLKSLVPPIVFRWLIPAFIFGASVWVGFIEATTSPKAPWFGRIKHTVGVMGAAVGLFLLAAAYANKFTITTFQAYDPGLVQQAAAHSQPVLIDFGAAWCTDCTLLEEKTYSDPQVLRALTGFVNLKADLTKDDDPKVKDLYKRYDIQGLPTVIFLAPDGHELKNLRLTGFEAAPAFVQRVERVRSGG